MVGNEIEFSELVGPMEDKHQQQEDIDEFGRGRGGSQLDSPDPVKRVSERKKGGAAGGAAAAAGGGVIPGNGGDISPKRKGSALKRKDNNVVVIKLPQMG